MTAKVMAADQDCPACQKDGVFHLIRESTDSFFRYYGCPRCGHIFGVHKDHPRVFFHITPLAKNPAATSVD